MPTLDRKLLRDLWHLKGQATAISLVIACGVATFVLSLSTLRSLELTKDTYYDRYRFAHVFAHLKRAPDALAARLAEIPGVAAVETRIVVAVNLDVPGLAEPAVGRFISLPDTHEPALNRLHLRRGRMLRPYRDDEILASEAFADANRLEVGDTIRAVINGRRKALRIVGIALSPEYIYEIQEGDILPDSRHFGVFWMNEEALSIAYDLEGAFNDISLGLMRGASVPEVIHRVDRLIEPYGGLGSYSREDQTSNLFISNEIEELRGMGMVVPMVFLGVAAFLLNVVLSRMIGAQREQIAALKAFGYSNVEVGWHYWKLVLVIATIGVLLGTGLGAWMGRGLTRMYTQFFHFPVFSFYLGWSVVPAAWAVSGGAAVLGTVSAVLKAVRLPPAEAMRPEPPARYRRTVLEVLGLGGLVPPVGRMVLRQIERHPIKSALSCLAVGLATGVLVLGNFMQDSLNYMMEAEFYMTRRYDMSVTMVEPVDEAALYELSNLPGVHHVEPVRSVPVRIRGGPRHRRVGITGIRSDGELHKLVDIHKDIRPLPPDGLVVSATLAKLLDVDVGDEVMLEVLERERPTLRLPIVGQVHDFAGTLAYMNISALQRVMREGPLISGAYLRVDPLQRTQLYAELKRTPKVAGVAVKETALESFRNTFAENLLRMRLINVLFAVTIAIGVVYNAARISLAERSRELATLRVIGFTRGEISAILLGELAIVTLVAIPIGLVLGRGMCTLTAAAVNEELFRIPIVVSRWTYAFAATVILLATAASALLVRRRLDHLDLIAVLKARE